MFKIHTVALFILMLSNNFAQNTLTFDDFKQRVLNYHPIIRQAANTANIGQKEVLKAKGVFDPSFNSQIGTKQFNEKEYYNLSNTGLKVPTWIGIDLKTGYEQNSGLYLDGQNYTPGAGLWYAGIEIPIGQGLFYDERRATVQSANLFLKNSKVEQELIVNDLLLDAYAAYWFWYEAFQKYNVAKEGFELAKFRYEATVTNVTLGENAGIDSVEASIQLNSREIDLLQANYDYQNAKLAVNLYLWSEDFIPLELEETAVPQNNFAALFPTKSLQLRFSDTTTVPVLMTTNYKLEQLKIEERLKKELLKPVVDLSYTPLSQPVGNNPVVNFNPRNYKFGVNVYVPLFLRKERGALSITKLKIETTELALKNKSFEIKQKEAMLRNDLYRLYDQLVIIQEQTVKTKQLRDSEQIRFENGESTLFLVNAREISYLSAKMKLAEMEAKIKVSEAKWLWLFGELD